MKKLIIILGLMGTMPSLSQTATEILKMTDRARGTISEGVQWEATVTTTENNETNQREFLVKVKENNARVEAKAPAKFKGEIYLFNDRNMWFYKPTLKKPVSISSRQKLSGQAANGDIASTNYARDYDAEIEKTEIISGQKTIVLLLKAKSKNLTYDKIRYYVDEKTKLAVKAEFLTLQGKVFKIGELSYGDQLVIQNKKVPFVKELKITDAKFPDNKSTIEYKNPKLTDFSDMLFNVNNLTR